MMKNVELTESVSTLSDIFVNEIVKEIIESNKHKDDSDKSETKGAQTGE